MGRRDVHASKAEEDHCDPCRGGVEAEGSPRPLPDTPQGSLPAWAGSPLTGRRVLECTGTRWATYRVARGQRMLQSSLTSRPGRFWNAYPPRAAGAETARASPVICWERRLLSAAAPKDHPALGVTTGSQNGQAPSTASRADMTATARAPRWVERRRRCRQGRNAEEGEAKYGVTFRARRRELRACRPRRGPS